MKLEIQARAGAARATTFATPHGVIETPVFMPVGTRASVRTQTLPQLERLAAPILLANTYHLMVSPGRALFERVGGLHAWMRWPRAILTDSGGFQVFSLRADVSEDGAVLRVGGHRLELSPETSIAMQEAIGADIMMAFDHCIDSTSPRAEARAAMARTHRWARRSLAARTRGALFGIVQGACFAELRRESAETIAAMGFDGHAIGGLAVGETRAEREDMTELVAAMLPEDRPRYLMGVGTPLDILEAVHRGVDLFDCVLPTALAQQGVAFTSHGRVDLRRGVYKQSAAPLDRVCDCEGCATYERSYLHHLVRCKEPLGWQLLASHNLRFYTQLAADIRGHLRGGTFPAFYAAQRALLGEADRDHPPVPPPRRRPLRPERRGAYELVKCGSPGGTSPHAAKSVAGWASIRHVASGEIMHSVVEPDVEAERVYVVQSRLLARARKTGGRVVVWDVGLGAAHNAMAILRACLAGGVSLTLVSFERDLDPLHLALANLPSFPHLRHEAPHRLVKTGRFDREATAWTLVAGDFLETFASAPRPDVICYDPFSAKVDGPLWSLATFSRLHALLAREPRAVELFTYSASTAVRSAMLAAGFHVARGVGSGPKQETTVALIAPAGLGHDLLGRDWLARRARSTAKFPADVAAESRDALDAAIRDHAQFAGPCPT